MIPKVNTKIDSLSDFKYPSRTYGLDLEKKRILGYIDGQDAIRQAISKIINEERYSSLIYSWNYGAELERFIGKDFDYIKAAIGGEIKEALLTDDRITGIIDFSVEKQGIDSCLITFIVESKLGNMKYSEVVKT